MKSIPVLFNDIIRRQLKVYAAWLPITNNLKLGDYGILSGDIFEPIGNILDDFEIPFQSETGADAAIDFKSSGTRTTKFNCGAKVDIIPVGALDAKVSLVFEKEFSFLIQSPSIRITSIPNPNAIANKLMNHPAWDRKFKVVYKVLHATEAVIISTIDAGTEINFTAGVDAIDALNNLQLGNAGISISSNKNTGLKIHGKEGIIGMGLFRIKDGIFSNPHIDILRGVKKSGAKAKEVEIIEVNDGKLWRNDI
ncbi:MAG: hypothetical protein ABIR66_01095 [Saprospiraceae bacterium]